MPILPNIVYYKLKLLFIEEHLKSRKEKIDAKLSNVGTYNRKFRFVM